MSRPRSTRQSSPACGRCPALAAIDPHVLIRQLEHADRRCQLRGWARHLGASCGGGTLSRSPWHRTAPANARGDRATGRPYLHHRSLSNGLACEICSRGGCHRSWLQFAQPMSREAWSRRPRYNSQLTSDSLLRHQAYWPAPSLPRSSVGRNRREPSCARRFAGLSRSLPPSSPS